MSTVLIIVIVVVVVLIVGLLLVWLPRARERARLQKRERELDQRRDQVVGEHREEAASRERQAEVAEQRARLAEQEAKRERAESELAQEKANLHERGLADHELIDDDEREHFAGTSAAEPLENEGDVEPQRARTGAVVDDQTTTQDPSRVEDVDAGARRQERR
jgi:FtsZ-interacting cell division protein ZipA